MNIEASSPRWFALAMVVILGACRGRTPPTIAVDWKSGKAEVAALLLLDKEGSVQLVCLPGRTPIRQLFPGITLRRLLDVGWKDGPMVAGWALADDPLAPSPDDDLVLLVPGEAPRRLAKQVRSARFSPDGAALAYEVSPRADSGTSLVPPNSYVLDLVSQKVTPLEGFADPLWEGDGRHLRGTLLRTPSEDRRTPDVPWTSLRARWDRQTGLMTIDGRGSAQVPPPVGQAVAWSEEQRSTIPRDYCTVLLNRGGGIPHLIVGRHCMGMADDLGVRWSPDGRWLAFTHPGPVPGLGKPGGFFVDVVGPQGGRYPALSALYGRIRPDQLAIPASPGSVVFDWSPSGRFLALQDGASNLRVFDFEALGIALLGKGERPRWSPSGAYLLILDESTTDSQAEGHCPIPKAGESITNAFVLPGIQPTERIDLGPALDARWLPTEACEK